MSKEFDTPEEKAELAKERAEAHKKKIAALPKEVKYDLDPVAFPGVKIVQNPKTGAYKIVDENKK